MLELNLVPPAERKPKTSRQSQQGLLGLGMMTLIIIVPELSMHTLISNRQQLISAQQEELRSYQSSLQERRQLLKEKSSNQELLTLARNVGQEKSYWTLEIAKALAMLPEKTAIERLEMNKVDPNTLLMRQQQGLYIGKNILQEIKISGSAEEQATGELIQRYEKDPDHDIIIQSIEKPSKLIGTENSSDFEISIGINSKTPPAKVEQETEPENSKKKDGEGK